MFQRWLPSRNIKGPHDAIGTAQENQIAHGNGRSRAIGIQRGRSGRPQNSRAVGNHGAAWSLWPWLLPRNVGQSSDLLVEWLDLIKPGMSFQPFRVSPVGREIELAGRSQAGDSVQVQLAITDVGPPVKKPVGNRHAVVASGSHGREPTRLTSVHIEAHRTTHGPIKDTVGGARGTRAGAASGGQFGQNFTGQSDRTSC